MTKDEEADLREWIEYTIDMLVSVPEKIRTEVTINERVVYVRVHGPREELGKVVGIQGMTNAALIRLINAMARRSGIKRAYVRTVPTDGQRSRSNGSRSNGHANAERTEP